MAGTAEPMAELRYVHRANRWLRRDRSAPRRAHKRCSADPIARSMQTTRFTWRTRLDARPSRWRGGRGDCERGLLGACGRTVRTVAAAAVALDDRTP